MHEIYSGALPRFWQMLPRGENLRRGLAASVRGSISGFFLGLLPGMRPALTAYKASLALADDSDVRAAYEALREEQGFRITDYTVESDAAQPRVDEPPADR